MSQFAHPPEDRYFEDYVPGAVHEFGSIPVEEKEVLEFGRRYVPLSYHVDKEAAKKSIYGGLIASGWHTVSACMRILVTSMLGPESGSLGSPGVDEVRWLKPVRPGDTLSVLTEVIEKRPSRSKPDRGLVKLRWTARNQDGEDVMTMIGLGIFRRRQRS